MSDDLEFRRVFDGLPDGSVAPHEVLEWVENHPAMLLRDGVELEPGDIADAPNKASVGQLRHWVKNRDLFYKEWMNRAKAGNFGRVEEDELEGDVYEDPKVDEIREMLAVLSRVAEGG